MRAGERECAAALRVGRARPRQGRGGAGQVPAAAAAAAAPAAVEATEAENRAGRDSTRHTPNGARPRPGARALAPGAPSPSPP
jgi:hypothetical protein